MEISRESALQRDSLNVLHPVSNLAHIKEHGALIIEKGKGCYVYDVDGREYLEGMAGLWCTGLGFSEPELVDAAVAQMRALPNSQSFGGRSVLPTGALAEKLKAMMPFDASKVFFVNSGSEANDTQIKFVRYYNNAIGRPQKKKIISRVSAYHGSTIGSGSLTGLANFHDDFDLPIANILHTDCPHYYRLSEDGETEEEYSTRLANNLEALITREGAETIAAFIAEPIMGAGGVFLPPHTYFEKIQEVLRRHDILFIADEVICGFYRTGNMFGCDTFNIKPDLVSLAKQLSSGYMPIGAVVIPEYMYEAFVEQSNKHGVFGHGVTYGGHPVAAAVALRTLELMEERDILGHVRKVAKRFSEHLDSLRDHPLVGDTRSAGLIGALELVADKPTRRGFEPSQGVVKHCSSACQSEGLIARALGDSLALCPPLIITEAEIDELFARLTRALDQTEEFVMTHKLRTA